MYCRSWIYLLDAIRCGAKCMALSSSAIIVNEGFGVFF